MKRTADPRGVSYKFSIMFMCVLVLAAVWCFCGCSANQENIVTLSPIVRIDLGSSTASGVIYEHTEEELVIVTAGHVLQGIVLEENASAGKESTEIASVEVFSGGSSVGKMTVKASEVFLSRTSETAFIAIPLKEIPQEILENCQMAPRDQERFDRLREDDAMLLKGYAADGELLEVPGKLVYSWIYAEDFAQYMMLVDGETFPGMSGGGIFDEAGNYMGILCGVNDAGESAAVPLSIILAEYAQTFY